VTNTDPALKKLVADTDQSESSIPLTLYLPSGPLYGYTTSTDAFGRVSTHELEQKSNARCVVAPAADHEYVHLVVRETALMPDDPDTQTVVRVALADVAAWSVG
jgi:hypothetical protein